MMNQMTRFYFAYGSNLNIAQMQMRCPTAEPVQAHVLPDFELVFRTVADMESRPGSSINGAIYKIRPGDEVALDRYEGFYEPNPANGLYSKHEFSVTIEELVHRCMYYKMNTGEIQPPSLAYYDVIVQGYKDWNLPLASLETALNRANGREDDSTWGLRREGLQDALERTWKANQKDEE